MTTTMKCREGCGEPADPRDPVGRCCYCNGTEDWVEPNWMQREAITHTIPTTVEMDEA